MTAVRLCLAFMLPRQNRHDARGAVEVMCPAGLQATICFALMEINK